MRRHLILVVRLMKNIFLLIVLILSIACPVFTHADTTEDLSDLSEASMNFDQEVVGQFLQILSKSIESGFNSKDAKDLTKKIDALSVDEEDRWEYMVVVNGKKTRLVVSAYKDDIDAPDLYFYTSPELASQIEGQLESFATSMGW